MRNDSTEPAGLRRMFGAVTLWQERRRGRAELSRLSAYQLKDIGLAPGDAYAEAVKPFWRG